MPCYEINPKTGKHVEVPCPEYKTIHTGMAIGEFPMSAIAVRTYRETVVDHYALEEVVGGENAEIIMTTVLGYLPTVDKMYSGELSLTIEKFCGTIEELKMDAKDCADYVIVILDDHGADDDHFDCVPAAVEEFILFCQQTDSMDQVQRVYDSLWHKDHRYYPLDEYASDPGLYHYFEIDGVTLHIDHPKE